MMDHQFSLLSLTSDRGFKAFLKQRHSLRQSLLEDFLPLPPDSTITDIKLLDNEETSLKDKTFILDLKLHLHRKDTSPETVIVEMQASSKKNLTNRLLAYGARIYSRQIKPGEDYEYLHLVYSLVFSIVNLKEFESTQDYCHVCTLARNCPPHLAFSQGMQFIIIELAKFSKKLEEIVDQREAWCYLLKNSSRMDARDCEILKTKGKDMPEAIETLWKLSESELAQEIAEAEAKQRMDRKAEIDYARDEAMEQGLEEGLEKGLEQGLKKGKQEGREKGKQEGREKGKQEGKQQTALAMLLDGLEIEKISKYTGLTPEEIKKLTS